MTTDDMKRHSGVHPRSRSSIWQWRIKAPVDLASLYPSQWAHRVSLGTADLREANTKAAALQAEWLARFEAQRKQLHPTKVAVLTPELGQAIADAVKAEILATDEWRRGNLRVWGMGKTMKARLQGMPEALVDEVERYNAALFQRYSEAIARNRYAEALEDAEKHGKAMGLEFDENTPGYVEMLRKCLIANKEAFALCIERDKGEVVDTPKLPALAPETAGRNAPPAKPKYLRDVFDRWKESGDKPRTRDSIAAYDRALRQFEAQHPQVQLPDITRDMGDSYRTFLRTTSKTSKTANDKFTAIKSLLKYAAETLQWLDAQPWRGLSIQYATTNKRRPWTEIELKTLFGAPLHQAYELPSDKHAGGDAAYWMPLLALYTGARAGELCQLHPGDVKSVDGIPALVITDEGKGQKVKTAAGHRTIPIHSELIRLGFVEYAEAQQKRGATSLWPALPLRAEKASDFFGRWFLKHRLALGLPNAGTPDGASMHHFRHTVRPLMRRGGFDSATQDKITGHETKGSVGDLVYDHWLLVELRPAVEAIQYPFLNLPKAYKTE